MIKHRFKIFIALLMGWVVLAVVSIMLHWKMARAVLPIVLIVAMIFLIVSSLLELTRLKSDQCESGVQDQGGPASRRLLDLTEKKEN